ncbi:MAG: O-antigen ligase family protein [bacterium]
MGKFNIPKIVEYSTVATSLLLAASLIFEIGLVRIPVTLFCCSVFADIIINRRWKNAKWDKSKLIFIAMILYYLLGWVSHSFETENLDLFYREIENRLPFIAFGIIGLLGWVTPKLKPQHIAIVMIATSLICTLWSWTTMLMIEELPNNFGEYQHLFIEHRVNSHMVYNIYLNTTILFSIYSLLHTSKFKSKIAYGSAIAVLYAILLTTEGRVGFFTANLLIFGVISYLVFRRKRLLFTIPYTAIAIILFGAVIMSHEKVKDSADDPRIAIWENTINLIKEKPIFGHAINGARIAFIENRYNNEEFAHYLNFLEEENKDIVDAHPHNVFLNSMLEFGIIGILLLGFIYAYPLFVLRGERFVYTIGFIMIIGVQSLFESYTSWGVPLMLFLWLLTYLYNTPLLGKNKSLLNKENS